MPVFPEVSACDLLVSHVYVKPSQAKVLHVAKRTSCCILQQRTSSVMSHTLQGTAHVKYLQLRQCHKQQHVVALQVDTQPPKE